MTAQERMGYVEGLSKASDIVLEMAREVGLQYTAGDKTIEDVYPMQEVLLEAQNRIGKELIDSCRKPCEDV